MCYRSHSFLYTLNCANSHVIHRLCDNAYISVFVWDAHLRLCFTLYTSPNMKFAFIEGCDLNLIKDYPIISSPVIPLHICYSLSKPYRIHLWLPHPHLLGSSGFITALPCMLTCYVIGCEKTLMCLLAF